MLPQPILDLEGMSSPNIRNLLNDLGKKATRYMEVGVWKGSTFISAGYDNTHLQRYLAIDNWSQFGGPRDAFYGAVEQFRSHLPKWEIIERAFPFEINETFDLILYDGDHDEQAQYFGVLECLNLLDERGGILCVDDYYWEPIYTVTNKAMQDCKYADRISKTEYKNTIDKVNNAEEWWNGFVVIQI